MGRSLQFSPGRYCRRRSERPGVRFRVFDPFFTTKKEGTGLGLAICKHLIERHHGTMELADREQGGTVVSILLPMSES